MGERPYTRRPHSPLWPICFVKKEATLAFRPNSNQAERCGATMNSDIRLHVTIRTNRKIKKLRKKLGGEAVLCLVFLWVSAAVNEPDGVLRGWDVDDIALESDWQADPDEFLIALLDFDLLRENESGDYFIVNWEKHQSWVIGAEARSQKAQRAANLRWEKNDTCSENVQSIHQASPEHATSIPQAPPEHAPCDAPLLSSPILKKNTASGDADEVNAGNNQTYISKKKKKLSGKIHQDFIEFWDAFDFRKGKAEAADAFLAVYSTDLIDDIIDGARCEAKARQNPLNQGKTPKWAEGWLSGRRWEDEQDTPNGSVNCEKCQKKQHGYCDGGKKECQSYTPIA